jgi:hypothetical protein
MRFCIALVLGTYLPALAQETEHMHHDMSSMQRETDAAQHAGVAVTGAGASGTAFNPASAPMNMVQFRLGNWRLMVHGLAFLTEIQQTGPEGRDKFTSMNWVMGEASHSLGRGTFDVRTMLSLEPATITERRYPELFQTGETAYGRPIVNGQHPHDLFMELAVRYTYPIGERTRFSLYAAPVGDPALGPVAYPHRVSAAEIPQATLSHHLQDSTHISNEVITAGLSHGIFGIEASAFRGAEPNENRWNIDHGAIDSYSGRITVSPNPNWTGQVSIGRLTKPEALEPGDQVRATASVTYNRPYTGGNWATSLIWGRVHKTSDQRNLNGYGLESVARFREKNYLTGRIELVDKDELFEEGQPLHGLSFRIAAFTAGYTRDFFFIPRLATGLGANFTVYNTPSALNPYFGNRPVAALIFVRFKLREMKMDHGS